MQIMAKKPLISVIILSLVAVLTGGWLIEHSWQLPISQLFQSSQNLSVADMALQLKLLPTMIVAVLAGGLLGLASILLQQLVKNNLASDTTLSVGSGSQMALLITTLFLPNFGLYGSFWVAFVGAMASMGLVFLLAKQSGMNPVVLVLSGLIINILLTAIAGVFLLFYSELALGVMAWGSGVLTQSGWQASWQLALVTLTVTLILALIYKPLVLMSLDDRQAKSLGVPVNAVRLAVILLVAMAVAVVISHVGAIGFIGLASATLVNVFGVQKLYGRLVLSFIIGGLLLWITSNVSAILASVTTMNLPAGAMTALFGTPLIIWLILTNKTHVTDEHHVPLAVRLQAVKLPKYIIALALMVVLALLFAPTLSQHGALASVQFGLVEMNQLNLVWDFRLPRSLGAMAVGVMLANAGVLLQTLTRNPMASPEVLGIGSAVALSVVLSFMLLPMFGVTPTMWMFASFGLGGAVAVLALILWLSQRVPSSHLLLVGVAISALMVGVLNVIKLIGDPRLQAILGFLSGSTYSITLSMAIGLSVVAVLGLLASLVLIKLLTLMSLGRMIAVGRGVAYGKCEMAVLMLIAVLSVCATLAVGPLSFVGLMTPHLAMSLGATRLSQKLLLSAILGAMLMLIADWIGRYTMFPYEIPAGTISAVLGGAYFMYLMKNMRH